VKLIDESPSAEGVARATTNAAEQRLRELTDDPSLTYCFWLLTRVAWASRSSDFGAALADIGVEARASDSVVSFIARLTQQAGSELSQHPESGPFSELASLAMRSALTETVGQQGRSLFGSSLEDLQAALRRYSTSGRFAQLAKGFFGDFFARTLRFFVDKELGNNVGTGHRLSSLDAATSFGTALDLYSRQSARIMETFAEEWYSKHNWQSKGQISREEAQGFTAVALRKMRKELTRPEPEPATK